MAQNKSAMRTIALRSLAAHKVRFLLTILSVVLGTTFVAGSFMLTSSLSKTFDSLFDEELAQVNAVVSPTQGSMEGIPVETLEQIGSQPGVEDVNIQQDHSIVIANADGEAFQTGGAPSVISPYYPDDQQAAKPIAITSGHAPHGPGEVLLNDSAAESHNVQLGDTVKMVDRSNQKEAQVVGTYDLSVDTGGYTGLLMDAPAFLEEWNTGTVQDHILVSASAGTSESQLIADLEAAYPDYQVRTGEQLASEMSADVNQALSFVNYFLIAFGLVALLVGTFIIANTFAMIVAQRLREFALLRSLGVSQRQITTSVVFEAVVVGVLGSLVGVAGGAGLVFAIYAVMDRVGFGLPSGGVNLNVQAVAVPLVLGTLATVVSAWAPARAAGRVKPVEAMRSGDSSSSSPILLRSVVGVVGMLAGIGLALAAALWLPDMATSRRAIMVGLGALALVVGTFLASPALSIPLVPSIGRVLGWPFGAIGKLAATNSRRNPRRTANTAFALTLGVALVTSFGMLGATMKSTVSDVTESSVTSDFLITGAGSAGGSFPLSTDILDAAAEVPGVSSVATWGVVPLTLAGQSGFMGAGGSGGQGAGASTFYAGDFAHSVGMEITAGTADAAQPGVLVDKNFAAEQGWEVGQQLELSFPGTPLTHPVPVSGIYEPNQLAGKFVISDRTLQDFAEAAQQPQAFSQKAILSFFVNGDESVATAQDQEALKQRLVDAIKPFIVAQVVTPQEYAGQQAVMIDQMLSVLYAMLALSIVIAVLGIINTLALNVIERRREIGMLRAVGTHRGQIRRMITLEAVQIAVYGAVVGVAIGLVLGWSFVQVLADEGLGAAAYPWGTIVGMLIGSAVVGVVAAVWPAIKASRTSPLEAIAD